MANTKAYTYPIGPKLLRQGRISQDESGSTLGPNVGLIDQTSPAWVLSFVRWDYRDTLRTPTTSPNKVRPTMVVENDCIEVTTSDDKAILTPNMSAFLLETDLNYAVEIHPGDFVFVNMLNWEADARRVADNARAGLPINGQYDGFKGVYKVQSVRKVVRSDPDTGVRNVVYKIDGFAFTEFNNTVYFNPNLINQKNLENRVLFINDISPAWASFVSRLGRPYVQEVIAFLIQCFIGTGVNPNAAVVGGLVVSQNTHFLVPLMVGRLLGVTTSNQPNSVDYKATIAAKDIYNYIFGIQQYTYGQHQTLTQGMNPSNLNSMQQYPGFYYTNQFCGGTTLLKPEYWNQVKLWSILNQYTNAPLNELYTCFRVSPGTGRIMPTLVFRQIPFTSEDFFTQQFGTQDGNQSINITRFLTLPRWAIGAESIFSADLGTDEVARINFVQYYAKSNFSDKGLETTGETSAGNYTFDAADINRSGLRPYVVQNQFDDSPDVPVKLAPVWARILGDAVMGGQLRVNGTIECIGIAPPIAVGDNLQFDGAVYHIERVVHSCSISPDTGIKMFRTTLSLSHGVSINSSTQGTLYEQMTYADAYKDRAHDYQNEQILPGVSESQDVVYRNAPTNPDTPHFNKNGTSPAPFPQPTTTKNKIVTGE